VAKAKQDEPLLRSTVVWVPHVQRERVAEYLTGLVKGDSVLPLVPRRLASVPLE